MKINLNTLQIFDAAARHLNFKLASQELYLTQSAVAQRVRKLEADLNVQLFIRKARGLELTDKGRSYHTNIEQALQLINKATREISADNLKLTISVPPSFAAKWLIPKIANFNDQYPQFKIEVVASNDVTNFDTDDVDLAIRQGKIPTDKKLAVFKLAPLNICAVCAPHFLAKKQLRASLSELVNYRLIEDSHQFWHKLALKNGTALPKQIISVSHSHLAIDAAINGQGITLTPELLVTPAITTGQLVKVWQSTEEDEKGFYIVYPKQFQSDHLSQVVDWMLSEAINPLDQQDD